MLELYNIIKGVGALKTTLQFLRRGIFLGLMHCSVTLPEHARGFTEVSQRVFQVHFGQWFSSTIAAR